MIIHSENHDCLSLSYQINGVNMDIGHDMHGTCICILKLKSLFPKESTSTFHSSDKIAIF